MRTSAASQYYDMWCMAFCNQTGNQTSASKYFIIGMGRDNNNILCSKIDTI